MGSGVSERYAGTWGARRHVGEVLPTTADGLKAAALLAAAAVRLGISEDALIERLADHVGVQPGRVRKALFEEGAGGGGGGLAIPQGLPLGSLPSDLDDVFTGVFDGLAHLLGIGELVVLISELFGNLAQVQEAENEKAEEERERRPGIYENCLYAEQVTGEKLYRDDPRGLHFGEILGRKRGGQRANYTIAGCGGRTLERANALFEALSRGYVSSKPIIGTALIPFGIQRELSDGTSVSYRWKTKSLDSPAVEIRNPGSPLVRGHKVHFQR